MKNTDYPLTAAHTLHRHARELSTAARGWLLVVVAAVMWVAVVLLVLAAWHAARSFGAVLLLPDA